MKDNVLYRQWFGLSQTQSVLQLVLPMCLRKLVLSLLHEQKCSDHFESGELLVDFKDGYIRYDPAGCEKLVHEI